jgi:hypothetical protein
VAGVTRHHVVHQPLVAGEAVAAAGKRRAHRIQVIEQQERG